MNLQKHAKAIQYYYSYNINYNTNIQKDYMLQNCKY